jgi:hypothetical protein
MQLAQCCPTKLGLLEHKPQADIRLHANIAREDQASRVQLLREGD